MTQTATQKSTFVRAQVPRRLRISVQTLDKVAPSLVARGALRMWCTPTHAKPGEAVPGSTPWQLAGGISGETWGEGPRVYLVHGWGGHRAQMAAFVEPLVAAGFQVIAYDAPSHGASGAGGLGRKRSSLIEMMDAIETVIAAHGHAHAVIGHSLGAAAAALAVLDGTVTDRLVLIAPPAEPVEYTRAFASAFGFKESTRQLLLQRMEVLAERSLDTLAVPQRAAGRTDLPPLLVVADSADKETDPADGLLIAESWPDAEVRLSDGLGHRRILRDAETIAAVVDYL
ncbi:alpha/beta fold hydrolase [Cellulomonas sp. URHE0023]|uniref:alpha/beta fold hydrolase n=1 Tax=Cellulomonas sp. URHE0023 TaxID=1380354 RepID=UPI000556CEC2|nr:alpha/beta fold hydrolase [Cellulomonas sp. URHE0023]